MRVVIHSDATPTMGIGHLMRCLALADALRHDAVDVTIASHEVLDSLRSRAAALGIPIVDRLAAPRDPDWIVVDGYHLDADTRATLADPTVPRLVVDDLGIGADDAAVILNQNLFATPVGPSRPSPEGELLAGPTYALLRPDLAAGASDHQDAQGADRILVTMGGADPDDATSAAVVALANLQPLPRVRVLLGPAHPAPHEVEHRAAVAGFEVIRDAPSLAPHLDWAEIVVSACGTSVLEVARFGRPIVGVVLADNQQAVGTALEREELGVVAGRHPSLELGRLAQTVDRMRANPALRESAAANGPRLVDGRGAERVSRVIRSGPLRLRRATMDDADLLLAWRIEPAARGASFDQRPIERDTHIAWLAERIVSPSSPIWIGLLGGEPVGTVRFALDDAVATISVAMDASRRASGIGTRLISLGCARLAAETTAVSVIEAWIKRGNHASEIAFQRAGFRLDRDDLDDRTLYRLPLSVMG